MKVIKLTIEVLFDPSNPESTEAAATKLGEEVKQYLHGTKDLLVRCTTESTTLRAELC